MKVVVEQLQNGVRQFESINVVIRETQSEVRDITAHLNSEILSRSGINQSLSKVNQDFEEISHSISNLEIALKNISLIYTKSQQQIVNHYNSNCKLQSSESKGLVQKYNITENIKLNESEDRNDQEFEDESNIVSIMSLNTNTGAKKLSGDLYDEYKELMATYDEDALRKLSNDDLASYLKSLKRLKNSIKKSGASNRKTYEKKLANRISYINQIQFVNKYISKTLLKNLGFKYNTKQHVEELKDICIKYNITTVERLRHFLGQCSVETGGDQDLIENDNKAGTYLKKMKYYPYYGAGRIQITWKYGYQAFAIYEALQNCPELCSKIKYLNPKNNSAASIESMYNNMVKFAKEKKINIKAYTDIVAKGPEYVAKNYAWESAGYFWEVNDCNDVVDSLGKNNTSGVDKITKIVNQWTDTYQKRRNSYDKVSKSIK